MPRFWLRRGGRTGRYAPAGFGGGPPVISEGSVTAHLYTNQNRFSVQRTTYLPSATVAAYALRAVDAPAQRARPAFS
jgi:hypothetical protein